MALDFPTSPTNGQKYPQPPVAGQPVYTWDGEKWKAAGSGIIPTIMVSDSPPINPPDNALWWESDSGLLYLRYNDGDTSQWVIAAPQPDVSLFAPVDSPVFTGDPKAPTPATADNDTSIATTAFVKAQGYAPLADPALTGNPTAPTPAVGTDTTQVATTAFVKAQLNSPVFTGDPQAPTPATTDNDTSIATTAFVKAVAVRYDAAQTLTAPQQTQARSNIAAAQVTTFDTSWKPFPYVNGWVDYGTPYSPCGYRITSTGIVLLKGLVMNGSASTIMNLPAGYRPGITLLLNVQTSPNVACRIDISSAGAVSHTGGSAGWISLGGICFLAEG